MLLDDCLTVGLLVTSKHVNQRSLECSSAANPSQEVACHLCSAGWHLSPGPVIGAHKGRLKVKIFNTNTHVMLLSFSAL